MMSDTETTRPDLSITIVSYNTCELTKQCLQSIAANQGNITSEIYVVDNNSSDGTVEMITKEFPSVNLIVNKDNKGLAAATNQGLFPSEGRYLLALNSDTELKPGAFETLVRFMDEHPRAGGAMPKLILPDGGDHPRVWGNKPTLKAELIAYIAPLSKWATKALPEARFGKDPIGDANREIPCILWGTSFIVRRETFEQVGGQDPRFFVYSEDVDWSMSISKAGWELYYVPEACVIHYGGQSTKQASAKMSAQLVRSRCRLIRKHYGILSAGILRLAIVFIYGAVLLRWLPALLIPGKIKEKASSKTELIWKTIVAALSR